MTTPMFSITWCDHGEDCESSTTDLDEALALFNALKADTAITWAQIDTMTQTLAAFDRTDYAP